MNRFSKIALSKTETLLALKWLYCTISSLIQRGVSRVCTSVVSPTKGVNSSAESFTTGCVLLCGVVYYRVCASLRCCILQVVRSFAVLFTSGCALLCGVVYTVGYTSPRFRLHWRGASPQRHLLYIGVRSSAVSPIPHMRYSQGRPHNVRTLNTWQSYCLHGWTYCLAGVGGLVDYRTFLIIRNLKIHFRQFCMNTVLFECMEIRTTLCLFL